MSQLDQQNKIDLYGDTIPEGLKDLQKNTWLSDTYIFRIIKLYPEQVKKEDGNLLLGLEIYADLNQDPKKALEELIDQGLNFPDLMEKIVDFWLTIKGTKAETEGLKSTIDYTTIQSDLYDKLQELKSKKFDKITLDNDSRNKALESVPNPVERLVVSYISTKDIPFPDAEAEAKNIQATTNDEKIKKLSVRELIEQKDRVPWGILKDLKLPPEQAKSIKELNYKTFIQIIQANHTLISPELVINAIKHEETTDKVEDKIIEKWVLTDNARQKYGAKIAKAVVNYSIDQVFGNSLFKKSAAAKEIKTELDVANLLAHYITSGKIEKIPKPIIDKNQSYTDSRVALKDKTETSSQEEARKQNELEIEKTINELTMITKQKEALESKELEEVIHTIDWIDGWFIPTRIVSEKPIKRKKGVDEKWNPKYMTYCSEVTCMNLENLLKKQDIEAEYTRTLENSDPNKIPIYRNEYPNTLKKKLYKNDKAEKLKLESFSDPEDIKEIRNYFKSKVLETKGNMFDIFFDRPDGHRSMIFLWSDGEFYALEPYHNDKPTINEKIKPVPLEEFLNKLDSVVTSHEMIINKTIYGEISLEGQKKLWEAYKKLENNYSLQTKLEEHYGDPDIVEKLSQYNDESIYHDENIVQLPKEEPIVETSKVNQPEIIKEDFTLAMLKLHVPKIYGNISYEELYTAIINIADPSLKIQCIQKIKTEKVMDFQLLLWMLKDAPLENRADGKIGQYTLNKIRDKINNSSSIAEYKQWN